MKSRGKKRTLRPVNPRLAQKLEGFGRLAAFLDGFDGHPLEGVIEYFRKGWPTDGFTEAEEACIRRGYHRTGTQSATGD